MQIYDLLLFKAAICLVMPVSQDSEDFQDNVVCVELPDTRLLQNKY